jgi:hypothetical protein
MRKRHNILASAILTIGTVGSIVACPVLALATSTASAAPAVASSSVAPSFYYHG